MNEVNIYLNGAAGSAAVLTFTYEEWPIYGEISLSGDPEILEFLELQLSMPQPIIGPESYPTPLSKGYLHAYAAARATANMFSLEFVLENPPAYPDREETAQLWRDVPYIGKDMYSEMMERAKQGGIFSDALEDAQYSRAANPSKIKTKRPRKKLKEPIIRREGLTENNLLKLIAPYENAIEAYVFYSLDLRKYLDLYTKENKAARRAGAKVSFKPEILPTPNAPGYNKIASMLYSIPHDDMRQIFSIINEIHDEDRPPDSEEIKLIIELFASGLAAFNLKEIKSHIDKYIPSEQIIERGKDARRRAIELFYDDLEFIFSETFKTLQYDYSIERYTLALQSLLKYRELYNKSEFTEAPVYYQEAIDAASEVKKYYSTLESVMHDVLYKIKRDNIAKFGRPEINSLSYGNVIKINKENIPADCLGELEGAVLNFQALVAPTIKNANMEISVVSDSSGDTLEGAAGQYESASKTVRLRYLNRSWPISSTVYHEITHAIEEHVPEISAANLGILKIRSGGDIISSIGFINEAVLGDGDTEIFGIRDSFLNPYTGRIYYGHGKYVASEVSTTAVDQLSNGYSALSLMLGDPQLFSHALAICYGTYFDLESI